MAKVTGLGTIQIPCPQLEASKQFYSQTLGTKLAPAGEGKVAVALGDGLIVLYGSNQATTENAPTLSLAVDDVDGIIAACKASDVPVSEEPVDQPWGQREAAVTDPSGYKLFFQQPA